MGEKYSVQGKSHIHAFGYPEYTEPVEYGGKVIPPFLEITVGETSIQLTPEAARELAAIIVREADKAEQKEEN